MGDATKVIISCAITFILSLVAVIPLIKWRLKDNEKTTAKMEKLITDNTDKIIAANTSREKEIHALDLLIRDKDNTAISVALGKVAEALLVTAQTTSKVTTLIDGQNNVIAKIDKTCNKAHSRIDDTIKDVEKGFTDIREKYVSHMHYDAIRNNIG